MLVYGPYMDLYTIPHVFIYLWTWVPLASVTLFLCKMLSLLLPYITSLILIPCSFLTLLEIFHPRLPFVLGSSIFHSHECLRVVSNDLWLDLCFYSSVLFLCLRWYVFYQYNTLIYLVFNFNWLSCGGLNSFWYQELPNVETWFVENVATIFSGNNLSCVILSILNRGWVWNLFTDFLTMDRVSLS